MVVLAARVLLEHLARRVHLLVPIGAIETIELERNVMARPLRAR